jgi:hypothetical protein
MDETQIAPELEKYPAKFPDPLPAGARKAMFRAGRIFGILEKAPGAVPWRRLFELIPVGGALCRLRRVSDDGRLVELEKEQ